MIFVDTNVFLRYLTGDDRLRYGRCRELFEKAVRGEVSLFTSEMVIAELVWTLQSFYKVPKAEVIEKVLIILNTPNLHIPDKDLIAEALLVYGRKKIDYIDAYNAAFMRQHRSSEIFSYDTDFDLMDGVNRTEP